MSRQVIVDTGPLVALLNRKEKHHGWAQQTIASMDTPLLTCEAVLSEACFLLRKAAGGEDALLELVSKGYVDPVSRLSEESREIRALMAKYSDLPMSLADACLVRMAEQNDTTIIATLDHDFTVYRRNGDEPLRLLTPP